MAENGQVRARREVIIQEHIDAENRHDPDATVATFSAANASYDIPAFGEAGNVPDHETVRQLITGMFAVFPDFDVETERIRHGDDHVLAEVWLSGTQHADWSGIKSQRRSFKTRLAAIFDFDGDQLVCEHVFMRITRAHLLSSGNQV